MDEEVEITGWFLAGIATIMASLSSAVAWLYKSQIQKFIDTEAELKNRVLVLETRADTCEQDRNELRVEHAKLEAKCEALERQIQEIKNNNIV